MNDKMKAEFEAAITEKFGMSPDQLIAEDENPAETSELVGLMYWVWCASRQAVVVTLPEPSSVLKGDHPGFTSATLAACRSAIEAAGLRVAP